MATRSSSPAEGSAMFRIVFILFVVAGTASVVSAADPPQRLPSDRAKEAIADYERRKTPDIQLGAEFRVNELTSDVIWERLRVQVFKVTGGVRQNESYVLRGKDVIHIGVAFGGDGVTTLAVADL